MSALNNSSGKGHSEKQRSVTELENRIQILESATRKWDEIHRMLLESQKILSAKYDQVQQTRERMEQAMKAGDLAWWDWMVESGGMKYNEERGRLLGFSPDELPKNMDQAMQAIHPDDRKEVEKQLAEHLEGELPYYEAEYRLRTKEGKWRWFHDRGKVMVRDIKGNPLEVAGVLLDITDRKEAEEALREARDLADAANKAKTLFLSNMSHEIYTPMAGVVGMAEILKQSGLEGEQREYLDIIMQSANNLMAILNDIMEFIQVENNKVILSEAPVNLGELQKEIVAETSRKCQKKGLALYTFFDPQIPDVVMGDQHRIRQLVQILVSNAVKFTDEGSITLSTEFESWQQDVIRIRFRISDTGIGIPEKEVKRLFQSFTRLNTKVGKYGGSGLGLSIAEHLARLMNGSIEVQSVEGEGSSFICSVEFQRLTEQERFPDASWIAGKRFLLVDSDETARNLLRDYLLIWEGEVEVCQTSQQAKEMVRHQKEAHNPFDLLLVSPENQQDIPADFSGSLLVFKQDVNVPMEAMKQADIRVALYRPFFPDQLLEALKAVQSAKQGSVEVFGKMTSGEEKISEKRVLNILLAEDNLINQKVALVTLKQLGHHTELAENGRQAVEKMASGNFDLILMDIFMPEMNGLDATREIRKLEAREKRKPVFICAITANVRKEDEEACFEVGMDAYITKPFRLEELTKILSKMG